MEILGFSAAKIILILIIAIVILGPDKVPEMARTVGETIRDVRRYLNDMTKEFDAATGGLREEFAGIAQDLRGELEATQADLRSQLDLTDIFGDVAASVTDASAGPTFSLLSEPIATPVVPSPIDDQAVVHPSAVASSTPAEMATPETIVLSNGSGTRSPRHATKADPFADLVRSTASRPDGPPDGRLTTDGLRPGGVPPHAPRRAIGHSVAGSAYVRRKSATVAPCRRLCRSTELHLDGIAKTRDGSATAVGTATRRKTTVSALHSARCAT